LSKYTWWLNVEGEFAFVAWIEGTSFPAPALSGDEIWRTDETRSYLARIRRQQNRCDDRIIIGEKTPGTLTARSETLNLLRNAIASSRSSHVFDLTRVTSVWGRRMAKGEEERGIALRTKREREREREREKRDPQNITSNREWFRLDGIRCRWGVMHLDFGVGHLPRSQSVPPWRRETTWDRESRSEMENEWWRFAYTHVQATPNQTHCVDYAYWPTRNEHERRTVGR